ncbi:Uncharacterized protein GBIM_18053 [Gryllus bimaculatus]|nr:Uncharacterized protein GBIM_18053 [Gryllus bimaculatus]
MDLDNVEILAESIIKIEHVKQEADNLDIPIWNITVDYRCHRNTGANYPSSKTKCPSAKNTNCPALLRITIKNSKMKRSKDRLLATHPCEIYIKHKHNHLIGDEDALRHRRPHPETERKIMELFASGHSPRTALDIVKYDLQELYGEDYFKYAADGAFCPSLRWAFNKYVEFKKVYGKQDGIQMIKSLENLIENYNSKCKIEAAKLYFEQDSNEIVVSICTPFMKRVHEHLKSSSEIMFVDYSGSEDRHRNRVFTLLAPSVAGALPVGIVILFSESENSFTKGLTLFKEILPTSAFFGNMEPGVIMTDDSTCERNSLRNAFPGAKLLLCKFHILQAFWRHLLNAKNNVQQEHRSEIFGRFQELFTCEDKVESETLFENIISSDVVKIYPNIVNYIRKMQTRVEEWMPAFTHHILTGDHSSNNIKVSNFRTIKNKVLQRVKAYNVVQLFHFLTTRYDSFFERKLADFLGNRSLNKARSRYHVPKEETENLSVAKLGEAIFLVKSLDEHTEYEVNTLLELCTCKDGNKGAPCKHQLAVVLKFEIEDNQSAVQGNNTQVMSIFHKILTGSEVNSG